MSAESITTRPHEDFVADPPRRNMVPGVEKIKTGHYIEVIYPKEDQPNKAGGSKRAQEHLPPPTGRDVPPASVRPLGPHVRQVIPGDQLGGAQGDGEEEDERMRVLRARTTGQPVELPPAPDSRTVVDPDPWAPRASVGDTLEGADGRELSESYGRPGAGMTSAELHHDGRKKRKRRMQGLEVYGAGVVPRELPESEESG